MKHTVTFTIDTDELKHYTDDHLADLWHVAQANPAPDDDLAAGRLADAVGMEIIRRWMKYSPGEYFGHSEALAQFSALRKCCVVVDGRWQPREGVVADGDRAPLMPGDPAGKPVFRSRVIGNGRDGTAGVVRVQDELRDECLPVGAWDGF